MAIPQLVPILRTWSLVDGSELSVFNPESRDSDIDWETDTVRGALFCRVTHKWSPAHTSEAQVWDLETGHLMGSFSVPDDMVIGVDVTFDGAIVVSVSYLHV